MTGQSRHRRPPLWCPVLAALLLAAAGGCRDRDRENHAAVESGRGQHGHPHDGGEGGDEHAHAGEVKLAEGALTRYGIRIEQAELRTLRPTLIAPARVAFNAESVAHVGSPLRGRAVEIKARLGDTVKVGDELVIIESPELGEAQSDFLTRRIAVQTAGPATDLAQAAWDRALALYQESQGISLAEVQRREAEHVAAVAALRAAHAAAAAAESRLRLLGMSRDAVAALAASGELVSRFTIRAPIAGQVIEREVTLGELVGPDRESFLVIADTTTVWVLADVPEDGIRQVAVGAKVRVRAGGDEGAGFEGVISHIAASVDAAARTVQVRIEAPGRNSALRPGAFAQAEISAIPPRSSGEPRLVVAVPAEAVHTIEGGPAIFVPVEGEESTFAKRAVRIGPAVGGLVPIEAGLAEGEKYVSVGAFLLKADLAKSAASHEH